MFVLELTVGIALGQVLAGVALGFISQAVAGRQQRKRMAEVKAFADNIAKAEAAYEKQQKAAGVETGA